MNPQEMMDRFAEMELRYHSRVREIEKQERLTWVLLALIALAPEIVMIGRMLLR